MTDNEKLMRTLDITYTDEDGHKSGAELTDYNLGDEDDVIFIETWDWFDSTGEFRAIGTIRKVDIPKLIAFLQMVKGD